MPEHLRDDTVPRLGDRGPTVIEKHHQVLACPPLRTRAVPLPQAPSPSLETLVLCSNGQQGIRKRSVHPFESRGSLSPNQLPPVRVWFQCLRSGHNILTSLSGNKSPHPRPHGGAPSAAASSPSARAWSVTHVMRFLIVPPVQLHRPPQCELVS